MYSGNRCRNTSGIVFQEYSGNSCGGIPGILLVIPGGIYGA